MPITQWALAEPRIRAVVLALIVSQGLIVPSVGGTLSRGNDGPDANGGTGFFAPATEMVAAFVQAITTTPWKGVAIGPEIVTGKASCPRSTDGGSVDCSAAARAICTRAGLHDGVEMSTATRRVCRGSGTITGATDEEADCKSKTSTTRALCW